MDRRWTVQAAAPLLPVPQTRPAVPQIQVDDYDAVNPDHAGSSLAYNSDREEADASTADAFPEDETLLHQPGTSNNEDPHEPHELMETEPVERYNSENSNNNLNNSVMPQCYLQCRLGKDATFKNNAICIGSGPEFGFAVGGETCRVSSFKNTQKGSGNCFVGSRVYKGTASVNQNICFTFDPATLMCMTCETTHGILSSSPSCLIVTDQNFVANLSGAAGGEGLCRCRLGRECWNW